MLVGGVSALDHPRLRSANGVEGGLHRYRLLGAHRVGPRADATINLFALAIRPGIASDALKATMFAYLRKSTLREWLGT